MIRRMAAGLLLAGWALGCGGGAALETVLTVGATTTLEDSGLLEELLARFRTDHPDVPVRAITGGTGEVLALGRRGDVDLALTHDPAAERAFVEDGHGIGHRPVFRSEFLLAGPSADPAGVAAAPGAVEAMRRIAAEQAPFVSRADDSGTHRKERMLWRLALEGTAERVDGPPRPGVDRPARDAGWYAEAGVGMGDALRVAGERRAYVLTDRPTFLMLRDEHGLAPLLAGDELLDNPYAVTLVSASPLPDGARVFADWLSSGGQEVVVGFGRDRFGEPLFLPAGNP